MACGRYILEHAFDHYKQTKVLVLSCAICVWKGQQWVMRCCQCPTGRMIVHQCQCGMNRVVVAVSSHVCASVRAALRVRVCVSQVCLLKTDVCIATQEIYASKQCVEKSKVLRQKVWRCAFSEPFSTIICQESCFSLQHPLAIEVNDKYVYW